jgi:allantoate deiminase
MASGGGDCGGGLSRVRTAERGRHDGMAMIDIDDVAMLFVRCRGAISHHPDERVETSDADTGAHVLLRLIENFRSRDAAQ